MPFFPYTASWKAFGHSKENRSQHTDENDWEELGYSFRRKLVNLRVSIPSFRSERRVGVNVSIEGQL